MERYAEELARPSPSSDMIARVHERKTTLFDEALERGEATARPGVARLVDAARERGVKLGFVTSTERANVGATARAAGLELSDFDIVTHRGTVENDKPDPAAYVKALEALGLEPHEAIAIEDTEVCVPAATDAELLCVATPNAFAAGQDFSGAVSVVDHLGDERRAARTLAGHDVVDASRRVTLDSLAASPRARVGGGTSPPERRSPPRGSIAAASRRARERSAARTRCSPASPPTAGRRRSGCARRRCARSCTSCSSRRSRSPRRSPS